MITLIKFLTWLASPIGLLACLSLTAASLRILNKAPKTRISLTTIAIIQLLFFASPWTASQLSQGLENKARNLQANNQGAPYAAILLLGGGISPELPNRDPANAHEGFDRITHAARLYHQGLAPKIIASGGTGLHDTYPNAQTEAQAMKNTLVLMGVPANAILTEDQSLNTRQNMAFSAILLKDNQIDGRLALVTSATHMPRANQNAQAVGLKTDVYPTDWNTPLMYRPFALRWLPNAQALDESERALKEFIALLANY